MKVTMAVRSTSYQKQFFKRARSECAERARILGNEPAQRYSTDRDGAVDTFNDLYSKNAPSGSIAAGDDYGRLNIMSTVVRQGLRVDYRKVSIIIYLA